jgi:hypothetical protein
MNGSFSEASNIIPQSKRFVKGFAKKISKISDKTIRFFHFPRFPCLFIKKSCIFPANALAFSLKLCYTERIPCRQGGG